MNPRDRFPRLWRAWHFGDHPDFQEERIELVKDELASFLGINRSSLTLSDMLFSSLGYTVEGRVVTDPTFREAIKEAIFT